MGYVIVGVLCAMAGAFFGIALLLILQASDNDEED